MEITCSQCSGAVSISETKTLVTCSFCGATLYLGLTGCVLHYYVKPVLQPRSAPGLVGQWLAHRDVPGALTVQKAELFFYPLWFVIHNGKARWSPAGASLELDQDCLGFPAGDLKCFDREIAGKHRFEMPTTGLDTTLEQWGINPDSLSSINKLSLIHIPILSVTYRHRGKSYSLSFNAVTGKASTLESPPGRSYQLNAKFAVAVGATIALFALESALLPGMLLSLLACGLTGAGLLFFFERKVLPWMRSR